MSLIGNKKIEKIFFGTKEVTDAYIGNNKVFSSGPAIDPVLNNNDWATIRAVCEAGNAANYWAVGDTKSDVGTDSATRSFQIVDMQGLYSKHVVFLEVGVEGYNKINSQNDNNYSLSAMRTTGLPGILLLFSSELQNEITNTTYKVAEGKVGDNNSSTILELTDKLFLPAAKELMPSPSFSFATENAALTQYQYYVEHSAYSDRIKERGGSGQTWWLRSPNANDNTKTCSIDRYGYFSSAIASSYCNPAPAFSF